MLIAVLVGRLLLAAVFAVAGTAKLADRQGSRQALTGFGVPAALVRPAALVLPVVELAVAAALLVPEIALLGALAALVLLIGFIAAIARNLARGVEPDCRCFGQLHTAPAGWSTLIRNAALAGVAALVVAAGSGDPGPSPLAWIDELSASQAVATASAGLALVLLTVGGWFMLQLLRQHGRLLVRIDALELALRERGAALPEPAGTGGPPPAEIGLRVGTAAPDFSLTGLDGDTLTRDSLLARARPLLLIFSEPGCGPCNGLLPEIAEWQREHEADLTIALISNGKSKENRAKAAEHGLGLTLLQREHEVYDAYRASGTPSAVLVSAEGTIASPVATGAERVKWLISEALGPRLPETVYVEGNGRAPASNGTRVGEPAPKLELADLDGKTVSLQDFIGSEILVLFWNPSCGFCRQMLPDLRAWEERRPDKAPLILVVSTGTVETNREMGLASPVVLDEGFEAGRNFDAGGTPMGVLIDRGGRIAAEVAAGADAVFSLIGGNPNGARAAPRETAG